MLWTERYAPKSLAEFAGNTDAVTKVKRWALDWERGQPGKALLLWGPSGVGKGALVSALANEMGWETVEMNASDFRTKANVERVAGASASSGSLFGSRKLIFIDDIEAVSGTSDRGAISAVMDVIKNAKNPVILTAEDFWETKLKDVRMLCTGVGLKKVNESDSAIVLDRVLAGEKKSADGGALRALATLSCGDLRSAVNDLQAISEGRTHVTEKDVSVLSGRDRGKDIRESVEGVLKAMKYEDATRLSWGLDVEPDMFVKWMEENVPREYTKAGDLARALNSLSRADIFLGRIRSRQYWGFLRYVNVLMTAGVALAKEEPYHEKVKYEFPLVIMKLSRSKFDRAKKKAIGAKIGAKCHVSAKEGAELFGPLLARIMSHPEAVPVTAEYFEFDTADVAYILGTSEKHAEELLGTAGKEKEEISAAPRKRAARKK